MSFYCVKHQTIFYRFTKRLSTFCVLFFSLRFENFFSCHFAFNFEHAHFVSFWFPALRDNHFSTDRPIKFILQQLSAIFAAQDVRRAFFIWAFDSARRPRNAWESRKTQIRQNCLLPVSSISLVRQRSRPRFSYFNRTVIEWRKIFKSY